MVMLRRHGNGFRFDTNHYAILWMSFKGLSEDEFLKVGRLTREYLSQHNEILHSGTGFVFGKHDIITEFYTSAARVASYHAYKIQKMIDNSLNEKEVCSSLVLGNFIINEDSEKLQFASEYSIKAYTFLNFSLEKRSMREIMNRVLDSIRNIDPSKMKLVWNASSYCLMMVSEGDCYESLFSKIIEFRRRMQDSLYESCTFFTLKYDDCEIKKDKRGKNEIPAITYVKFGKVGSRKLRHGTAWYPTWFYDVESKKTRFASKLDRVGWYDITLGIVRPTLRDITEELFRLREDNIDQSCKKNLIHHTSTLLMRGNALKR